MGERDFIQRALDDCNKKLIIDSDFKKENKGPRFSTGIDIRIEKATGVFINDCYQFTSIT